MPAAYSLDDEASILGHDALMLARLHAPDGTWLVPDVEPFHIEGYTPKPGVAVVVDTGVCEEHPSLAGRIVSAVDLTGEGARDEHGHGTAVAAILAATSPWLSLISVKALGRDGKVRVGTLCEGFREAVRLHPERGALINVSAGRQQPECAGNCPMCRTVGQLQRDFGVVFVCAAGNDPGPTACPGRAAISVSTPAPWDGPGDLEQAPPGWRHVGAA